MKSLYIFFFLFVVQSLFGQHTFQRTYEISDRVMIHGGLAVANDGGFYMINLYPDQQEQILKFHVTRHHYKGDVLWSYDYEVENHSEFIDFNTDIITTDDKGVVFAFTEIDPNTGGTAFGVMVKVDEDGEFVWSKTVGSEVEDALVAPGEVKLVDNFTGGHLYANLNSDTTDLETNAYLASFDQNGLANWSNLYKNLDEEGLSRNSFLASVDDCQVDSSFMMAGIMSTDTSNLSFLSKIDREGEMLWSKSYQIQPIDSVGFINQVTDVACGLDTTTAFTGLLIEPITGLVFSYVCKVDINGDVLWTNLVGVPGVFPLPFTNQVIIDNNDNVVVSGKMLDIGSGEQSDYIIRLNSLGDLVWSKTFPRINTYFFDQNLGILLGGDLEQNGTEYMLSGGAVNFDVGSLYPFVVRIDEDGNANCEENAMALLNDTLVNFQVDTLFWEYDRFLELGDAMVEGEEYLNYDLPMVTLLDTFFCPQDPIMVTLDATAQYAESYEWSTGETTPTIEVTEDGEYMVTVTFDTLACFTLCDTSIISKLEFPSLAMSLDNSNYCETGEFIASAGASAGLPPYTYMWGTGETSSSISVTEYGNYAVTITDGCGNSESSQINLSASNLPEPEIPAIDFNQQLFCETGVYQIRILNAGEFTDIVWSTGETTDIITVPGPGPYSVTAVNCFQEVMASVDEGDFAELQPLGVNSETNNAQYCIDQTFPLSVTPTGGLAPYTYSWSTGDSGPEIIVTDLGTYSVTISDNCMDEIVEVFELTEALVPAPDVPMLATNFDTYCTTGDIEISLTNPDGDFTDIVWSNGQEDVVGITVGAVGTYTVAALSCFQDVGASIDILESDLPSPQQPILEVVSDSFCNSGLIDINITNAGNDFFNVEWSTGAVNTAQIMTNEAGTYSVTALNCFQQVEASIDVNANDFPTGLEFPNTFMPGNNEIDEDKTFGPFVECPEIIEDYEFKIFNRWGKMVFESDNVSLRWNGAFDGKRQPSEVFYWYARYLTPAGETLLEGDVTLLR